VRGGASGPGRLLIVGDEALVRDVLDECFAEPGSELAAVDTALEDARRTLGSSG
jgi:hypothetical protein